MPRGVRPANAAAVQREACSAVAVAVRRGVLPLVSTLTCEDCGRAGEVYDHRDYTKPLQVVALCRSCNVLRGPADVWPSVATAA